MKKVSDKQSSKDREVSRIKRQLIKEHGEVCCICHCHLPVYAMHLLPKSVWPEYYTEPRNIQLGCPWCHDKYDNDIFFRQKQTNLFNQIASFDEQAARRYFKLN